MTLLTQFQYETLRDAAASSLGTCLLIKPNAALDPPDKYDEWTKYHAEIDELVLFGLIQDVSADYSAQIERQARTSGRLFRVFKITQTVQVLFTEGHSDTAN